MFKSIRKRVWNTHKKKIRKTIRNVSEKFLSPQGHLQIFHRHFSKSCSPPQICTKKNKVFFLFTGAARLCRVTMLTSLDRSSPTILLSSPCLDGVLESVSSLAQKGGSIEPCQPSTRGGHAKTSLQSGPSWEKARNRHKSETFRWPQPPVFFKKYCRTNGGRTAVQMGGVLQYKWEAYCRVSLSSKLRSQESTAIQMGGVLPYKLEVYCRTF